MSVLLRALRLQVSSGSWRHFAGRELDPKFQKIARKIFERDQYICQFCGFQAKEMQKVVNLDGNYKNNHIQNLSTICCLCAQCFFLEMVGKHDSGGGLVLYLPEMSQNDLNGLCHVLFCAMTNATTYRNDAQKIYNALRLRSQIVEKKMGKGLSNPSFLGQRLIDARMQRREEVASTILKNLRLLPSYTKFKHCIDIWANTAFNELTEVRNQ